MDTVALQAANNESFNFMIDISAWSQLYPLAQCMFKSQMRSQLGAPLVLFEWSFANNNLTIFLQPATGAFSFILNPTASDTITIGTTSIKFVASGAVGNQVNIGGSLGTTLTSLMALLTASIDPAIVACSYVQNGTLISLTYNTAGGMGNSFPIATSNAASVTPSGALLSGGLAILQMVAIRSLVTQFNGTYYYDAKLYFQGQEQDLFGGPLVFIEGVTI